MGSGGVDNAALPDEAAATGQKRGALARPSGGTSLQQAPRRSNRKSRSSLSSLLLGPKLGSTTTAPVGCRSASNAITSTTPARCSLMMPSSSPLDTTAFEQEHESRTAAAALLHLEEGAVSRMPSLLVSRPASRPPLSMAVLSDRLCSLMVPVVRRDGASKEPGRGRLEPSAGRSPSCGRCPDRPYCSSLVRACESTLRNDGLARVRRLPATRDCDDCGCPS